MKYFLRTAFVLCLIGLNQPVNLGAQTPAASQAKAGAKSEAKQGSASLPSSQEISDAKAKGLVWANLSSHVYHKDGRYYGTTKNGKFMTEADAQKAGFREAKPSSIGKKATASPK